MKANELRIGNLVTIDDDNEPCPIGSYAIADFHLNQRIKAKGHEVSSERKLVLNPIPLTEERLLEFGAIPTGLRQLYSIRVHDDLFIMIQPNGKAIHLHIKGGGKDVLIDCEYVHNLQNLYYVLSGKELEIQK